MALYRCFVSQTGCPCQCTQDLVMHPGPLQQGSVCQSRGFKCWQGFRKARAGWNLALPSQTLFHRSGQLQHCSGRNVSSSSEFLYTLWRSENHPFIHAILKFPQSTIPAILLGFVSSVCLREDSVHVLLTFSTGRLNLYILSEASNDIYSTCKAEKLKKKTDEEKHYERSGSSLIL